MNYYFITPPNPGVAGVINSAAVRHHMVLGQHLIDDPAYREMYSSIRIMDGQHCFMVDNGAAEEVDVPFADVANAARVNFPPMRGKRAVEVTMPDVLKDADETIKRITDPKNLRLVPPTRRVVIPQGDTVHQWKKCCMALMERVDFRVLGIPKHLDRFPGGRVEAIKYAVAQLPHLERRPAIHLYGVMGSPRAMFKELNEQLTPVEWAAIRSVDSGCAVGWAQAGYDVDLDVNPVWHFGLKWHGSYPIRDIANNVVAMQRMAEGQLDATPDAEDLFDPT